MNNVNRVFFQKYSAYINDLQGELDRLYSFQNLKNKDEKKFYDIAQTTLESSGKLLRALLTLLACEVVCGKYKPAIPIAISYELAHNASLVQDDIIDNSPFRRGNPSVKYQYGTNTAILISDLFIFEIFNLISNYKKYNLSKKNICQLLEIVGACGREATVGEYLDEKFTKRPNISEKDYFRLIKLKTGKLFAASSACGAIVANGTKKQIKIMYKMGEKIGIAFQIYDDLLNIIGDETVIKKPTFSDIENGKQNLIITHALKNSNEKAKKQIKKMLGKKPMSVMEKETIKKIVLETQSIKYAKEKARYFIDESKKYLGKINNDQLKAKEKIIDISDFVIGRNI